MALLRRRLLPAVGWSALGLPAIPACAAPPDKGTAPAAQILKLGHSTPADHPLHVRLVEAGRNILDDSQGRVDLQIFPLDQLGSQLDVLGQVRAGAVDFVAISGLLLSRLVPASALSGLGFAFRDQASVWQAMDGGLGTYIRDEIEKTRTLFAFERSFDNGFRHITTSSRPVRTPKDLVGMKIRVPPAPMWVSLFSAFGAAPTAINTAEMYTALQTGLVDGQENPLALILSFKLYEVQKTCSLSNHLWDGLWLVGNRTGFGALPADVQAVVTRHVNAAAQAQRADLAALNATARDRLADKGLQFFDVDAAAFRERLVAARFYDDWRARFPAAGWKQLEAAVGPL